MPPLDQPLGEICRGIDEDRENENDEQSDLDLCASEDPCPVGRFDYGHAAVKDEQDHGVDRAGDEYPVQWVTNDAGGDREFPDDHRGLVFSGWTETGKEMTIILLIFIHIVDFYINNLLSIFI